MTRTTGKARKTLRMQTQATLTRNRAKKKTLHCLRSTPLMMSRWCWRWGRIWAWQRVRLGRKLAMRHLEHTIRSKNGHKRVHIGGKYSRHGHMSVKRRSASKPHLRLTCKYTQKKSFIWNLNSHWDFEQTFIIGLKLRRRLVRSVFQPTWSPMRATPRSKLEVWRCAAWDPAQLNRSNLSQAR